MSGEAPTVGLHQSTHQGGGENNNYNPSSTCANVEQTERNEWRDNEGPTKEQQLERVRHKDT